MTIKPNCNTSYSEFLEYHWDNSDEDTKKYYFENLLNDFLGKDYANIKNLKTTIEDLEEEIGEQEAINIEYRETIDDLEEENNALKKIIQELEQEVKDLDDMIKDYENKLTFFKIHV